MVGSWVKMGSKLILIVPVSNFQELFTELKKSLRCRDIACRNFKKSQNPIHFGDFEIFFSRFGKIPYFWAQINFRAPYWAKLLHFMGFTNVIWDFFRF